MARSFNLHVGYLLISEKSNEKQKHNKAKKWQFGDKGNYLSQKNGDRNMLGHLITITQHSHKSYFSSVTYHISRTLLHISHNS